MKILNKSKIPTELWSQKLLHIPNCLVEAYRQSLNDFKIMDIALSTENRRGPIGGSGIEETLQHFAMRYGVSVCRLESLVIDPEHAFTSISDDLLITFSDGKVSILDIPCGTGAAGTSIISTIAALRKSDVLPKLPLDIMITGGDYSQTALNIYDKMIESLRTYLNSVGINVYFSKVLWDAKRPDTTAALVDNWFESSKDTEEFLSIIANFSGETSKSFADFQRSFEHIHERLYSKTASVLWIEPKMSGAKKYFEKIAQLMEKAINWFSNKDKEIFDYTYHWYHPFQKRELPCNILVQKYTRH